MNKPYVIVNCAMSLDGKIALPTRKQLRISSDEDIARMYTLRSECDAVLVGINTVLSDDPKLTVKEKYVPNPKQPLRVILDSKCRTPKDALVLNKVANTLIITAEGNEKEYAEDHIEVAGCKTNENGNINLISMLEFLSKKGIKKLLVEGGGTIIWSFLNNKLVDEIFIYVGSCIIGGKNTPTLADDQGIKNEKEVIPLQLINMEKLGSGVLLRYKTII